MMEDQMRWPESPRQATAAGWSAVLTPLGAALHVLTNSPAWDLCTDWQLLHSGRGILSPTDPRIWFSKEELSAMPQGLVAELFAHASRMDAFTRLIAQSAEARSHILQLPDHVYGTEPEEWARIDVCVDLARCLDARALPRTASNEAQGD